MQTNILGINLELCYSSSITGFYRDGKKLIMQVV